MVEGSYTVGYPVETLESLARIADKDRDALELSPVSNEQTNLPYFILERDCEAIRIPGGQKITIRAGTQGLTQIIEGSYIIETNQGRALIVGKDRDALELRFPLPAPVRHAVTYASFAPALILVVLLLVNFVFTGLASWVTEDEDREWLARSAAWILITVVAWVGVNLVVLWGAQAISTTPGNQLAVFLGDVKASRVANALLGAFGGVTGIVAALVALRSKLEQKTGQANRLPMASDHCGGSFLCSPGDCNFLGSVADRLAVLAAKSK